MNKLVFVLLAAFFMSKKIKAQNLLHDYPYEKSNIIFDYNFNYISNPNYDYSWCKNSSVDFGSNVYKDTMNELYFDFYPYKKRMIF